MKRIYLIILLIAFPACFYAQSDAKAQELLAKMETAFKQSSGTRISMEAPVVAVLLLKEEMFFLNIDSDVEEGDQMATWFDGKTLWSYVEENKEVTITTPTTEELQTINPYILLQNYKEKYDCQYKGSYSMARNHDYHLVNLVPKDKRDKKYIELAISKDYVPVHIFFKNGDKIENHIMVISYSFNNNYSDDYFRFDKRKYPDAEIIDMR